MAFAALSINSKRKLLDEWHEEDADDEGGDEEEHEPKGALPMEELQPVPPRAIFDALNVHPPPNLSTQDLDHPFNRKAFGELTGNRCRSAVKVAKALVQTCGALLNSDPALITAALSADVLSKSKSMVAVVEAFVAAVRRGDKPDEIHRILSPLCAGDVTREQANDLFADLLGRGGRVWREVMVVPDGGVELKSDSLSAALKTGKTAFDGDELASFELEDEVVEPKHFVLVEGVMVDVPRIFVPDPVVITQHRWRGAGRHYHTWGAGGKPELSQPARRQRLKQEKLLAAMAHITNGDNLQLLAYGDHKIPLGNGESIVVGAALLRTCKAELFREHTAECEAAGKEPLDYKNYAAACSAAATGKTAMMGALDPVKEMVRLNLERGRQRVKVVGDTCSQLAV